MKNILTKKNIIKTILLVLYIMITFYIGLPALNLKNPGFYFYLVTIFAVYNLLKVADIVEFFERKGKFKKTFKKIGLGMGVIFGIFIVILLINFINSPLFSSKAYSKRIKVNKEATFIKDVAQVNFKALPLLDKDSSRRLGDRVMGQMPELVSQFRVSDLYTQINLNNEIVRVTPLEYANWIKYLGNYKEGIMGYITVNSISGESKLTKLEKGMKIMPSALLNNNLKRYLRFKYPTLMFDQETFEIDNEGNPYWIVPIVDYAGIGLRKEISGVVILNPITKETKRYSNKDIPAWVDHVFPASLVIEQVNDWGLYQDGFFNSLFGQKGVVQTTEGYNYTVMNDDVYLYTGITSLSTDESNLGFILTNLRTKETHFYSVPGAEEFSAMASSEGQVQQMRYKASFPLLINLNNRPTYLLSLKDDAGLVKMYSFVDVADYQKVVVSDATLGIEMAAKKYLDSFSSKLPSDMENITKKITINTIKTVLIDGNTYYYLTDSNNQKYRISIKVNEKTLPFIKADDKVNISYLQETEVIEIVDLSF